MVSICRFVNICKSHISSCVHAEPNLCFLNQLIISVMTEIHFHLIQWVSESFSQ